MGRTANPNLSVTVSTQNQTGPGLQAAAAEYSKFASAQDQANMRIAASQRALAANGDKVIAGMGGIGKSMLQGGAAMSKAGAIAAQLSAQLGTMGGTVGKLGGGAASLAGMLAAGGPLGLALVGVTAAVAAASYGWEVWTTKTRAQEEALKAAAKASENFGDRIAGMRAKREASAIKLAAAEAGKDPEIEVERARANKLQAAIDALKIQQGRSGGRQLVLPAGESGQVIQDALAKSGSLDVAKQKLQEEVDLIRGLISDSERMRDITKERAAAEAKAADVMRGASKAKKAELDDMTLSASEHNALVDGRNARELAANAALVAALNKQNNKRKADNNAMVDAITAKRRAAIDFEADLYEAASRKMAADREAAAAQQVSNIQHVGDIASSITSAMLSDGQKLTAAQRAEAAVQIAIRTAVGIATAAASGANVPFPGTLLAIGANIAGAAAQFAQIAKFKDGGIVGETQRALGDRDAVPIIAHKREVILSTDTVDKVRRGEASISAVPQKIRAGGGGGTTVVQNFNVMVPDQIATLNAARRVKKALELEAKLGR